MVIFGGAERMTVAALRALIEGGAEVHAILNGWEYGVIADELELIGATWQTSAYRVRLDRRTRNPLRIARQLQDMAITSWDLMRLILRQRSTHVIVPAHDIALRNWPALVAARLLNRTVILMLHNAPPETTFYRRLWRWAVRPTATTFVCNSRFTRSELLACGVPDDRVELIGYMVPERRDKAPVDVAVDRRRLIFVGQIIPEKGVHVLLDAVGLLVARGHDVSLDVVGKIEGWISPSYAGYWDTLKARAERPDLAGRVRFLGVREDVPELLRQACVHCCPSLPEQREAFGLVVIEAKAAGVPSVVFPTGALPELVNDGQDGLVCADCTAQALAESCARLVTRPDERDRLARAALASSAAFGRGVFTEAWRVLCGLAPPVGTAGGVASAVVVEETRTPEPYPDLKRSRSAAVTVRGNESARDRTSRRRA